MAILAKALPAARPATTSAPGLKNVGRKAVGRKAVGFAAMLALAAVAYQGPAHASSGGATVQDLYANLLSTMKNGSMLGGSGRYTQLAPVIRRSFDLPFMARLAFGPGWAGLTLAQQQQVTESYGRYISAVYAERFDSYHGQRLDVTGERQIPMGSSSPARSSKPTATRWRSTI